MYRNNVIYYEQRIRTAVHLADGKVLQRYNLKFELLLYVPGGGGGGPPVAQFVVALRKKLEGRGFDSQWCHFTFSLT
jgi:hypothetical protein